MTRPAAPQAARDDRARRTPARQMSLIPWEPSVTKEELDRRAREPGTKLADFWKRMGRS